MTLQDFINKLEADENYIGTMINQNLLKITELKNAPQTTSFAILNTQAEKNELYEFVRGCIWSAYCFDYIDDKQKGSLIDELNNFCY